VFHIVEMDSKWKLEYVVHEKNCPVDGKKSRLSRVLLGEMPFLELEMTLASEGAFAGTLHPHFSRFPVKRQSINY